MNSSSLCALQNACSKPHTRESHEMPSTAGVRVAFETFLNIDWNSKTKSFELIITWKTPPPECEVASYLLLPDYRISPVYCWGLTALLLMIASHFPSVCAECVTCSEILQHTEKYWLGRNIQSSIYVIIYERKLLSPHSLLNSLPFIFRLYQFQKLLTNITFTFLNLILLGSSVQADIFGHLTLTQNHSHTHRNELWQFSSVIWIRSFSSVPCSIAFSLQSMKTKFLFIFNLYP